MLRHVKNTLLGLLPNSWMVIKGSEPGTVHLTYDDGPDPAVTPQLLALLKLHNAKATFFLLGKNARAHPAIVRQIADDGHTLGNHSYYHNYFHKMPIARQMGEIHDTNGVLREITGKACRLFRAPAGKLSAKLFLKLVGESITYANWSRDTLDYALDEPEVVAALTREPIQDRDIVLMHDDHQKVVGITAHILSQYKNFRFTGM
jgi:peptidoglycan/xylan/chitin deacetylase (PgdA/CDA1 family)